MSARAVVLAAALLCGGAAMAVEDAQLARCATIADAAARLTCYDALANRPADPPGAAADFGLPPQQKEQRVTARLAAPVNNLTSGTLVKLDNGQTWQLIGSESGYFPQLPGDAEVVITQGFLGVYWLEIVAINRRFKVKRIS